MKVSLIRLCTIVLLLLLSACTTPVAFGPEPGPTPLSSTSIAILEATLTAPTAASTEAPPPDQSAEPPTIPPATTIPEPVQETPAGEQTEAPSPSQPPVNQLVIYTEESGRGLEFVQKAAQEFSRAVGWTIAVVPKASGDLRLDFETAALADQSPDMLWTTGDNIVPLAASELLQPVDGMFTAADFAPATVAAANEPGTQWGVPVSAGNQLVLLYNRKLLPTPPTTTDDLLNFTKPEGAEISLAFNQNDPLWLVPWLTGFGGRIIGEDHRPTLNTPEMVNAFDFLRQLRARNVSPPDYTFADGVDLFKAGQAAMVIDGDWSIPWYLDAAAAAPEALDLGVAPLPIVSPTQRPAGQFVSGSYLLVPRSVSGARLEMVKAFVSYVTSAEVQAGLPLELHRLPARLDVLGSDAVQADPQLKPQADALERGTPLSPQVEVRTIWNILGSRTGAVMVGEVEPATAAQDIQTDAEARLGLDG